jgi:hypothetical protein
MQIGANLYKTTPTATGANVVTDGDHQLPPVVTVGPVAEAGGSLGQVEPASELEQPLLSVPRNFTHDEGLFMRAPETDHGPRLTMSKSPATNLSGRLSGCA